jgi:DNA-binding MarR family transcriptional regulator
MFAEDSVAHLVADWRRERPDFDATPIGVLARLLRLSAQLNHLSREWLETDGLSWEAFSLIVTLRRQGSPYALRPTDILRESLLTSGAVTNRIDRVEAMGLVERIPDPRDRRAITVRLTPEGLQKADAAIAAHVTHLAQLFAPVGDEALKELDTLLSLTLATIERAGTAGRDDQ